MQVSPVLAEQGTYPFVRIERAKRAAAAAGIEILDFGQGDPREPTDPMIRQALIDALEERWFGPWQRSPLLRGQLILGLSEVGDTTVAGLRFCYDSMRGLEVTRDA